MIPDGWKDATLGDLVWLQRGHDLPSTDRIDGQVKVIGGGGPNGFHNIARAPAPGIVIGRSGSGIGNAFWTDEPYWPLNTGLYVTDFLGNDPRFCFLWLDWIDFTSHNTGGAQPSLNRNNIYPIPLPLPPLPEQQKIAEILGTWDKAIQTTEALLTNARTQKRALMQSLLTGARRFPGFEDHPWQEMRLGDVCEIRKGEQKSKSTLGSGGQFPVINGGISPSGYSDEWNTEAGTITISEGGNSCGFANLIEVPFWSGGHCYTLENLRVNRDYLFHWLKFQEAEIMRLRVGSGLPNIQKKAIASFPVSVPSAGEQARIADAISCMLDEEVSIDADLNHLRTEKKSLMQQLLTGKRRVVV